MGVSSGRLVTRRRWHWLTRGSHDIASLRRRVLGQHRGRSLIHGGRLRVLAGALPTRRHLAELGCQLFSLSNHVVAHEMLLGGGQQGSLRRRLGLWLWLL